MKFENKNSSLLSSEQEFVNQKNAKSQNRITAFFSPGALMRFFRKKLFQLSKQLFLRLHFFIPTRVADCTRVARWFIFKPKIPILVYLELKILV
jgi:hypothetical protein